MQDAGRPPVAFDAVSKMATETSQRLRSGAVIAVARRGRLVHYQAIGYLDRERGTPMTTDAIFAIASMTKPFAGVATLMLMEEGKLALGDPVERFLPQLGSRRVAVLTDAQRAGRDEGPIETVPAQRPITIQDLLRHTSGLTYGGRGTTALHRQYPLSSNWSGTNLTAEQLIERLAALALFQRFTDADDGFQACALHALGLLRHCFISLAVVGAAFGMAQDHMARAHVLQLRSGDVAGVRARGLGMAILPAGRDALGRHGLDQHRGRADQHVAAGLGPGQKLVDLGQGGQGSVHLPVAGGKFARGHQPLPCHVLTGG